MHKGSISATSQTNTIAGKERIRETANQNMVPSSDLSACLELETEDKPAAKLRLVWKDGRRSFFPYAYVLRTEFQPDGVLTIVTSELEIVIKGRGLDYVEECLYETKVKSIRESKVTLDSGRGSVYVASIEVRER